LPVAAQGEVSIQHGDRPSIWNQVRVSGIGTIRHLLMTGEEFYISSICVPEQGRTQADARTSVSYWHDSCGYKSD
jgi:hypothetical protein